MSMPKDVEPFTVQSFAAARAIDQLERLLAREPDLYERLLILSHVSRWGRDHAAALYLRLTGERHPLDITKQ